MKVYFLTGASRGFGALITQAALAAGHCVVATARDLDSLRARHGEHPRLLTLRLDVTREADAHAAVEAALARFGRIDVLINNAGYGLLGAIEDGSGPEVERLFATNVFGLLAVTRAVLPTLRRQRSGHVINLSSLGGYASYPGWGLYCASKFAVEGISEALHAELAPLGVHVTVVEPGFFRTDFLDDQSLVRTASELDDYAATVGLTRNFAAGHNHQQPGDPARLAQVLLDLADAPTPPLRLPLGSDAVARIEAKHTAVTAELATWREVSLSTALQP